LFDERWLFEKQDNAMTADFARFQRLSRALFKQEFAREEEVPPFLRKHYQPIEWLNAWTNRWTSVLSARRTPDTRFIVNKATFTEPGAPWYFVVAAAGVLVAMLRRGRLWPVYVAWGLTLLGLFFVIMLTANVRPRFRFVFEPFWLFYIALLTDTLLLWIVRPHATRPAADSPGSSSSRAAIPLATLSS
jgi:hypothetical protein